MKNLFIGREYNVLRKAMAALVMVLGWQGSLFAAAQSQASQATGKNAGVIALPPPKTEGKTSVEKALHERRSIRNILPAPLTLEEAGQLCWAAQGITDSSGHRTTPSARGLYPLDLYLVAGSMNGLAPGLYKYQPAGHSLLLVSAGDKRALLVEKAIGQPWVAKAPALFVVTGRVEKLASLKERGPQFMSVEAGLLAQGFFLQTTALGLGSTFVGGFKQSEAQSALGLPSGEEVLAVLPVGHKP